MTPITGADWVVFTTDHLIKLIEVLTAWPLLIAVALLLLRNQLAAVVGAVEQSIQKGAPFEAKAGPMGLALGQTPVQPLPADVPSTIEVGGGDELAVVRDLLERAEASATRWHFAYLRTYLAPHTMRILQWIASQSSKPTLEEVWGRWGRSVPATDERVRVLEALTQHELVTESDDRRLVPTERGLAFLTWFTTDRDTVSVASVPDPQNDHIQPYTAYGIRLHAGALVEAVVRDRVVASTRSDPKGNWKLTLSQNLEAGVIPGEVVSFRVDGLVQPQTIKWVAGGAPADAANGILFPSAQPSLSAFFDEQIVTFPGGSLEAFDRFIRASGAAGAWTVVNGQRLFRTFGNADDDLPFFNAFPNGIPSNTLVVLLRRKSQPV